MKKLLMIMAMVGVIAMAGTASAGPILGVGGVYYDLSDVSTVLKDGVTPSGTHDAFGAPDWWYHTADHGALAENGGHIRADAGDTEFKMTVTGLTAGHLYDVEVLYFNQGADLKKFEAGLSSPALTVIGDSNSTNTTVTSTNWYQAQSNTTGAIGPGTASGGGTLDIYFDNLTEAFVDGVVLRDLGAPVPEPAGLGLIGLALLAVRRKRS